MPFAGLQPTRKASVSADVSSLPAAAVDTPQQQQQQQPLGQLIINAVCDLMFCPEFTVAPNKNTVARDEVDDLSNIDSCEYIWASGVGFAHAPPNSTVYDLRRREILR